MNNNNLNNNNNNNNNNGILNTLITTTTSTIYNGVVDTTNNNTALSRFLIFFIPLNIITLYLFFKAKLPISFAKYYGRFFHICSFPIILLFQFAGLRGPHISKIDEHVYLGALPMYWDVENMVSHHQIKAIVNLCDEYAGPRSEYQKYDIDQLYIPVVDHYEPSIKDIKVAIHFIQHHVAQGHKVLIHCKAGRGRSGAIAICWVALSRGISLEEAQKYLIEKRKKVRKHLYRQKNIIGFYDQFCSNNNNNSL
ncbi:hypothetical protein CYY_000199 [Polysphondylium violaceum]|uniref:Uncharacterized protein n=1 Tax=Polysphondylium violaceum TaxID=133409 RepID=A0A8J4VBR0_9MYCE|nr:hypothetical protein CYY_000199 [Polysphondylium violaceum]